jgi:tetratricopeptide (TPR) repeat protein
LAEKSKPEPPAAGSATEEEIPRKLPGAKGKILAKSDWIAFWLTFLTTLAVYTWTLNPTVSLEDSGELAVAADYLGVPHPPGYPIWTLLGWFFQWIFDFVEYNGNPNPAWGVAFMSAFFGALACACIGLLISISGRHMVEGMKKQAPIKRNYLFMGIGLIVTLLLSLMVTYVGSTRAELLSGNISTLSSVKDFLTTACIFLYSLFVLVSFIAGYFFRVYVFPLIPIDKLGSFMYGSFLGLLLFFSTWTGNQTALTLTLFLIAGAPLLDLVFGFAQGKTPILPDSLLKLVCGVAGISGGLLFALSPVMWSQAVIVEVYSLNAFFMAAILLMSYLWMCRPKDIKFLLITGFLFGLGLTNHQSLLFLLPYLLVAIGCRDRELFEKALTIILIGIGVLCFFKAQQYSDLAATVKKPAEVAINNSATFVFTLYCLAFLGLPHLYFFLRKRFVSLATLFMFTIGILLLVLVVKDSGLQEDKQALTSTLRVVIALFGIGFFASPLYFLVNHRDRFINWAKNYMIAGAIGVGLLFHVYMAIASEQNPPMNWGYPRTTQGFKHALFRGQYEKISGKDNWDKINAQLHLEKTAGPDTETDEAREKRLASFYKTKFFFFSQLAVYFFNPENQYHVDKYSMVNMYTIPLSIIGLLPFILLFRQGRSSCTWFVATGVAMFFLTVVFMIFQYPQLDVQDLFIKRVQYIQAHGVFAVWIAYGFILLTALLYKLIPLRPVIYAGSLAILIGGPAVGMHNEYKDTLHLKTLGASGMRKHDFGWQFGNYQLKGANGIILDYLEEKDIYEYRVDDWSIQFLRDRLSGRLYENRDPAKDRREEVKAIVDAFASHKSDSPIEARTYRKEILKGLKGKERNYVEQAGRLAAYRHKRQQSGYQASEEEVPDINYPPPMTQDGMFFGGTDPGRFVPTYMIYSAKVRPDVFLITQNALADGTYMNVMRDLYGDDMWIPSARDSNTAFQRYITKVKQGKIKAGAELNFEDGKVSVQGVAGVMAINAILCQDIHEYNRGTLDFYIEESYPIPWMYEYLTPHGLILKLNGEPTELTQEMIDKDFAFWDWYMNKLIKHPQFMRDVIARKTFSKLRSSLAGMYNAKHKDREAELAYRQSLALYELSPEANFKLADFYIKRQRFTDAEDVIEKLLEKDVENEKIGQFLQSIAMLKRLNDRRLALEPKLMQNNQLNISTAFQLVGVYASMAMGKECDDLARQVMAMPRLPDNILYQLGEGMNRLKRKGVAKQIFEAYAAKKPDEYRGQVQLAAIRVAENRPSEAVAALQKAVALGKNDARQMVIKDPRFAAIKGTPAYRTLILSTAPTKGPAMQQPQTGLPRKSILPSTQK